MPLLQELQTNNLQWFPELEMGYFNVVESPYDENYFQKYEQMASTEMGEAIRKARLDLVSEFLNKEEMKQIVDIGIGCGDFVKSADCYGYDINPKGMQWLEDHGKFIDPYQNKSAHFSFWDSLEHIYGIDYLLANAQKYVFVSLPIFKNAEHILNSKHYRKDEHCWYFTRKGFISFMKRQGFDILVISTIETTLGREGIESFVFRRK